MSFENNKRISKKTIIIVLAITAAILLLMYLLTLVLPLLSSKLSEDTEEGTAAFKFYEPDFSENIFDDDEYMKLIEGGILKYDNARNSVAKVDSTNAQEYGEEVAFLVDYIDSVISGDSTRYNSFFSAKYFKENAPKENFTMQKIYDGMITYYSTEEVSDTSGNYTKYIYKLNYAIYENNGTFRKDIGEDKKTQYILITDREGKLLIDAISTAKYK